MKLTKQMKSVIKSRALAYAFDERFEKANANLLEAALSIMSHDENLITLESVPDRLRPYVQTIKHFRFYCSGPDEYADLPDVYLAKVSDSNWYQVGGSGAGYDDHPAVVAMRQLREEYSQYVQAVQSILDSVGTLNQLAGLSPALSAFCPDTETTNYPIPKQLIDMVNAKLV